jgi:hypothetical protein
MKEEALGTGYIFSADLKEYQPSKRSTREGSVTASTSTIGVSRLV